MNFRIAFFLLVTCPWCGCSVFRNTAVDKHVAVSRDLTLQGLAATSSQNESGAERFFSQAVDSDPDNVEARMLLAESFRKRGQVSEAINQLELALKVAPGNEELICQLGECYSVSQQDKYAYRLSQLALRKNRESVKAWRLKAQTLWKMGLKEPALADYQRALRIEPSNSQLRSEMASLYLEMDKPMRALTTLDTMADDYDESKIPEGILLKQSVALQRLSRNTEAVDRLRIGFDRGDYSEQFAEAYVSALMNESDFQRASDAVRLATVRFPRAPGLAQFSQQLEGQPFDGQGGARLAEQARPSYR